MSEWRECKLGNIADVQTGPFGSQLHASDYVEYGIPSIMPANIDENLKINTDGIARINEHDAKRLKRYLVSENDIVYSRRGDVEKCAYITHKESGWLCGTGCLRVRFISKEVSPKYCAYYLSTDEIKGWISANAVGSTMPNLNSSILGNVPLQIPSLPTQQAIAEILSSLDDKIDLLTRQNATLEALAQTYFRQWFVVGNENETITVSKIATLDNNSVNPARQPLESFYHYSIPAFDDAQTPVVELGKTILSSKFVVQPNTILVSKLNPITPRIWRIDDTPNPNSVCSTEFQVLKQHDMEHYLFLYCLMKSNDVTSDFTMSATGTSGSHQRIRPEYILKVETPAPDKNRLVLFNKVCTPLMAKVKTNQIQIHTLQKLRDALLPKLISGELKVKGV